MNIYAPEVDDMIRAALRHLAGVTNEVGIEELHPEDGSSRPSYGLFCGVGKDVDAQAKKGLRGVKGSLTDVIKAEFDLTQSQPSLRVSHVDLTK